MIVPDGHNQHHALVVCVIHRVETAFLEEVGAVLEQVPLGRAVGRRERIVRRATYDDRRRLNGLRALAVEAAHLDELAVVGAVGREELCHDGHRLCRVEHELAARAVERLIAESERLEVAPVLVAVAVEAVVRVVTARDAVAPGLAGDIACVGCVGSRDRVCLPDVHLHTARAVLART